MTLPVWPGATVVVMASGPSLTDADVASVKDKARVIVVNTTYQKCPWADVLYAADKDWWLEYRPVFAGLKVATSETDVKTKQPWPSDVLVLQSGSTFGLERDTRRLALGGSSGANSGYQAINLAVHCGASRIVLLGYDMQRSADGKIHWHGNHPENIHRVPPFAEFLKGYASLVKPLRERGIEIVNATPRTALTCFPKVALAEALSVAVAA